MHIINYYKTRICALNWLITRINAGLICLNSTPWNHAKQYNTEENHLFFKHIDCTDSIHSVYMEKITYLLHRQYTQCVHGKNYIFTAQTVYTVCTRINYIFTAQTVYTVCTRINDIFTEQIYSVYKEKLHIYCTDSIHSVYMEKITKLFL